MQFKKGVGRVGFMRRGSALMRSVKESDEGEFKKEERDNECNVSTFTCGIWYGCDYPRRKGREKAKQCDVMR